MANTTSCNNVVRACVRVCVRACMSVCLLICLSVYLCVSGGGPVVFVFEGVSTFIDVRVWVRACARTYVRVKGNSINRATYDKIRQYLGGLRQLEDGRQDQSLNTNSMITILTL